MPVRLSIPGGSCNGVRMSSKPSSAPKSPSEYDEVKLEAMTEPLTVNIEKLIAGRPQPVELPIKPGESIAGVGWSKNDVRELPTFLGRKGTGAGMVRIKVTDVNQTSMKWEWFFSPADYVPLPAMSNAPDAPPSQLPVGPTSASLQGAAPQMQQQAYSDPYGGWLGTVVRPGTMPPNNVRYSTPLLRPVEQPGVNMHGFPTYATPPQVIQGPGTDDRLRDEREARLRLEGDMARQALENRYKEQIGGVSNEVRQLQSAIGQVAQLVQQSRPEEATSAATRALEAQIEALKQQNQQNQFTQALAAMQSQTAQMFAASQANVDKQIAALVALVEKASAKPTGPDPMIVLMMDAQKNASAQSLQFMQMMMQQSQQAQAQASQVAIGPRETIELMKSMNTGGEQQALAYSKAWEMMTQGVEQLLHAQGPGVHPVVPMIEQGIAAAVEMAGRSTEAKEKVGIQQAQAMAMQAQANMALANQLQLQRQGQLSGVVAPVTGVVQPAPEPPASEPDESDDDKDSDEPEVQQGIAATAAAEDSVPQARSVDQEEVDRRTKVDRGAFGLALPAIKKMRRAVADGMDVEKTAMAIMAGIEKIAKLKVKIPALELWKAGSIAECIELMLPDTSISFREKVIETIVQFVQAQQAQQDGASA